MLLNRSEFIRHTLLCAVLAFTFLAPRTFAGEQDKKTIVTFNGPVEFPGKALPAGTYLLKLADTMTNRNIIEIYDKNEEHLMTTVLALPNYRLRSTDKPVINFEERASNAPEAIRAFFYPGGNYGLQFVYPHDQAVQIARRTNQNVLSMRNDATGERTDMEKVYITGVNSDGEAVPLTSVIQTER